MVALNKNTKSKLSKVYKKYSGEQEEPSKIGSQQYTGAGLGITSSTINTASTGNTNVGMGIATGAASGAAAGSIAGPWGMAAGAVIGGTVGGVSAQINNNKAKKAEQEYKDAINKENYNLAVLRGQQTPVNGNQTYSLTERKQGGKLTLLKYPNGGLVPNKTSKTQLNEGQQVAYEKWKSDNKYNESDDYDLAGYWKEEGMKKLGSPKGGEHFTDKFKRLAPFGEGDGYQQLSDESNVASQFDKRGQGYWDGDKFIAYKQGGKLSALSSNTMLATGATHEEGGIKLPQLGAEVEDKETLKMTKDGGTYVMSDTLVNPTSGNTFAKDDLRLSKMKGRLEKINHSFGKNALTLLKNKEQKLVDLHEQVRQEQGLETANGTQVARNGGMLKYSGLQIPPSKITLNNQKFLNSKFNAGLKQDGIEGINTRNGINNYKTINPYKYSKLTPYGHENEVNFSDPLVKGVERNNTEDLSSLDNMQMINPEDKTSNKFDVSSLSKLTPYIDNITGAIYNSQRSKEKLPNLKTLDYLNPNLVNYSQAIKDTRDTTTAFNRGVDTTNVNQGNANIMKAFALGEQQKAIARISQEESNVNVGIKNDFAGRNKAIEEKNNMTIFNNAERSRLGRDEIRRESQQNIVDANKKFQTQYNIDSKNKNQESDDKDAELASEKRSRDYIESEKTKRKAKESSVWSSRNGGKLSKLKISY